MIELDIKQETNIRINNLKFTLDALRTGIHAIRYAHIMSESDQKLYEAAREVTKHTLAKQFDNASDDELATALANHIQNLMECRHE